MRAIFLLSMTMFMAAGAHGAIVTVPVTHPDASGPGGLAEAIATVNAADPSDIHVIEIDLGLGQWTIDLQSPLPTITQRAVIIRGTRSREEGLYTISGEQVGTLIRMDGNDALLYSIENVKLTQASEGCALMRAQTVTVVNSVLSECQTQASGTSALRLRGNSTIRDSDLLLNTVDCSAGDCTGGAVDARNGKLKVESSYFGYNRARGGNARGGAIRAFDGIEVQDSMFEFNEAGTLAAGSGQGGAIHVRGQALIYRSAFFINMALSPEGTPSQAGAILQVPYGNTSGHLMRLWNVFFWGNQTTNFGRGGAVYQSFGDQDERLDVRNATFYRNSAVEGADLYFGPSNDVSINNSILAQPQGGPSCYRLLGGSPSSGDWNLLTEFAGCDVNGLTVADVDLDEQRTVGRLRFRGPAPNSPAINAGNPASSDFNDPTTCRPSDLIGTDRPWPGSESISPRCDIGAVEFVRDSLFSDGFEN